MMQTLIPGTQVAEAGRSIVWGQPGVHNEILKMLYRDFDYNQGNHISYFSCWYKMPEQLKVQKVYSAHSSKVQPIMAGK